MAIKCNICGGNAKYNIKTQRLECVHCGDAKVLGQFGVVDSLSNKENAPEKVSYSGEKVVYECPECGAQVKVFTEENTVFCAYCGKQTFPKQEVDAIVPSEIVPFQKDLNDVRDAYRKELRGKLFVPTEFKNPEHIEEFRGVYIPHWSLNYQMNDHIVFEGNKYYTEKGYEYEEIYDIYVCADDDVNDVTFDASESFSDAVAYNIAPFKTDEAVKFEEGYLAGFYVDKETKQPDDFNEEAKDAIFQKAKKLVKSQEKSKAEKKNQINIQTCTKEPNLTRTDEKLILLPVWFLTHRVKDRISYSVMNGQTGKLFVDLPVDNKKFNIFVGIMGCIFTLMLLFIATVKYYLSAIHISVLSLALLSISSVLLHSEIKKIQERDQYLGGKRIKNWNQKFTKELEAAFLNAAQACEILCFLFYCIPKIFGMNIPDGFGHMLFAAVFICIQISITKGLKKHVSKKEFIFMFIEIFVAIAFFVTYYILPQSDLVYYGLSALAIIGTFINAKFAINRFYMFTSRPTPNFYKREHYVK